MKTKVIELLYSWTLALPEESKIKDAYHMLKRQGVCLPPPPSLHTAPKGGQSQEGWGCLLSPSYVPPSLPETVGWAWLGFDRRGVCTCSVPAGPDHRDVRPGCVRRGGAASSA